VTLTAHLLTRYGEEYVEHFLHCTRKNWIPGAQSKDSFPFTLTGQFSSILSEPIQQLGVNLIQFISVQAQQTDVHLTLLTPLALNDVQKLHKFVPNNTYKQMYMMIDTLKVKG